MIHRTTAFQNDHLILTRWELIKLFFGAILRDGPLHVQASSKPNP